jgi:hypothetical protein
MPCTEDQSPLEFAADYYYVKQGEKAVIGDGVGRMVSQPLVTIPRMNGLVVGKFALVPD